jgi:hypothetical protein
MKATRVAAILVWLLGASTAVVVADPIVIPAGADQFATDPSGTATTLMLPAGFFGAGSLPFSGQVHFQGNGGMTPPPGIAIDFDLVLQGSGNPWTFDEFAPCSGFGVCLHTAPQHMHQFGAVTGGPVDTSVSRLSSATLPDIGSSATVPIQIGLLSLRSVGPIQVGFSDGGSQFFDVFVDLDDRMQPIGSMTIFRTFNGGGTFTTTALPINGEFTFVVPEPASLLLLGGGLFAIALRIRQSRRA